MIDISELGEVATDGGPCDRKRMALLVIRFFFHDLSPSMCGKVEAHLSKCPRCMGRYEALAAAYGAYA